MITVMYKHLSSGADWQTWRTVAIPRLLPQCWYPAEVLAGWLRLWSPQTRVRTGRHTDLHRWMFLSEEKKHKRWSEGEVKFSCTEGLFFFFFQQSVINLSYLHKVRDNVDQRTTKRHKFLRSVFPLLTAHVEANHRLFLHLAVRGDRVSHHASRRARQNGSWAAELLHGSQTTIWLHEQDVHILRTKGNTRSFNLSDETGSLADTQQLEHLENPLSASCTVEAMIYTSVVDYDLEWCGINIPSGPPWTQR